MKNGDGIAVVCGHLPVHPTWYMRTAHTPTCTPDEYCMVFKRNEARDVPFATPCSTRRSTLIPVKHNTPPTQRCRSLLEAQTPGPQSPTPRYVLPSDKFLLGIQIVFKGGIRSGQVVPLIPQGQKSFPSLSTDARPRDLGPHSTLLGGARWRRDLQFIAPCRYTSQSVIQANMFDVERLEDCCLNARK